METTWTSAPSTVTLREVASTLRRRWTTVLAATLACGALATAAAVALPAEYAATATVSLYAVPDNPLASGTPRPVNAAAEVRIAESSSVAERTAAALGPGVTDVPGVEEALDASAPTDSDTLVLTWTAADPDTAARGANAAAQAYLGYRSELYAGQFAPTAAAVDAQIAETTRQQQDRAAAAVALGVDEGRRAAAAAESTALGGVVERLREQRSLLASAPTTAGHLVGPAAPPTTATGPSTTVVLAGGLGVGLLLGLVLALVRHRLVRRVESREQVEERLGVRVLAEIRTADPQTAAADVRVLAALIVAEPTASTGPVLIVGTDAAEAADGASIGAGWPAITVGVAVAAAAYRDPVVLLCADPVLDEVGRLVAAEAGTGPRRPRVVGFGAEDALGALPQAEVPAGGLVLVDGVHVARHGTALALAGQAGSVLVCVRTGMSTLAELHQRLRDLDAVGADVRGVVLLRGSGRRGSSRPDPVRPTPAAPWPVHAERSSVPSPSPVPRPTPAPVTAPMPAVVPGPGGAGPSTPSAEEATTPVPTAPSSSTTADVAVERPRGALRFAVRD